MSTPHGRFVWYELATTDTDAAAAFYGAVIGWTTRDAGMPGPPYLILGAAETEIAGIMDLPRSARDAGAKPGWRGYIGVDDVDAAALRVEAAGGVIRRAAEDIPGIGRFAVTTDPQGAPFTLFTPRDTTSPRPPAGPAPGHVGWHELHAADWESAFAFYAGMFGWTKAEAIDMGPMGTYQLFATGGSPTGGMMTRVESKPRPAWLYYFTVDDIDAAVAMTTERGGQLVMGPHEVPGGSWIAQCLDPQGVMFAMVSAGRRPQG